MPEMNTTKFCLGSGLLTATANRTALELLKWRSLSYSLSGKVSFEFSLNTIKSIFFASVR